MCNSSVVGPLGVMLLAIVLPSLGARAEDNPGDSEVFFKFLVDGKAMSASLTVPLSAYKVTGSGWCGQNHRTIASNKYDHSHIDANVVPFQNTYIDPVTQKMHTFLLTKTIAEAGWDAYYGDMGFSRQNSSNLDPTRNCHNFALGLSAPVIHSEFVPNDVEGVTRVRQDEGWVLSGLPVANGIHSTKLHTSRIIDVHECNAAAVAYVVEKSDSSPVYERAFTVAEMAMYNERYPSGHFYEWVGE